MRPIWIVDDDQSIRWVLGKALERERMSYRLFESATEVLDAMTDACPSVLLSDIRMPDMTGTELLTQVKERYPDLPVIIMTAFGDLESAVSAFEGGAYEYLAKPFDVNAAVSLMKRACEESVGTETKESLRMTQTEGEIIGQSAAMQEVFRVIGRLSQSHATVLLSGESGTGKEVVARALHSHSPRKGAAFVAINMAAIPGELLESELFGRERGAFPGADESQLGRFEQAEGGTLFLDEIGDMPMALQTRLLRVLSDGSFYRVGGRTLVHADVRVIAATNQDLEERVKAGLFREDLYHRLNVIRLRLPPLRQRIDDIALLCEHFLSLAAQSIKTERKHMTEAALERLRGFPFPGNVRELENLCHWLTVMAPSQMIRVEDLPEEFRTKPSSEAGTVEGTQAVGLDWKTLLRHEVDRALHSAQPELMQTFTQRFEMVLYEAALAHTHGRRILAAQALGVGRNTLTRKLKELNLDDA